MKSVVWTYLLPVLVMMALTLPHLDQGDYRSETAHYGAIGLQAWRVPGTFLVPHEHPSVPYFNKPPLVFWIHGFVLDRFGVSLITARLPSILAAAGIVLLTVGLARRTMGNSVALAAGLVLASTYEYFRRTREISLDLWQLLFMMTALRFWFAATSSSSLKVWCAGLSLGLALLCKPFMALMLPLILLPLARCGIPGFRPGVRAFLILAGSAFLTALPWHLYMAFQCGSPFISQYLGQEVVARARGLRNLEPFYYYTLEIGRTYWPWFLAFGAGLWHWSRHPVCPRHAALLRTATLWVAMWFTVLSLFPDKRPRYALPLYPMMALICGYGIVTLPWRALRRSGRRWAAVGALITVLVATVVHVMPVAVQAPPDPSLAALTAWAARQPDPSKILSAAMTSSDESMIYLKAGFWPAPLRHGRTPPAGTLLIYTDGLGPAPAGAGRLVFRAGPYQVMER